MQNKNPSADGDRNLAIDLIRAFALLMMVSIHFARCVPDYTGAARMLKFFGESAPAFFFFAFGLTIHRLLEKESSRQFEIIRLFLYVAIAQGFMAGQPFKLDFFLFLWFWQLILVVASRFVPKWRAALPWVFGITIAALLVFPPMTVSDIFDLMGGLFPLLPWGLFILLGFLFGHGRFSPRGIYIALGLFTFALGTMTIGKIFQFQNLMLIKSPMTATYFFFFASIVLLFLWFADKYRGIIGQRKRLKGLLEFFSANLLLGTVLHYGAYLPVKAAVLMLRKINAGLFDSIVRRYDFLLIILGAATAVLLLWGLLALVIRLYDAVQKSDLFVMMRNRFDLVAVSGLVLVGAITLMKNLAMNHGMFEGATMLIEKSVTLVIMTYLALELRRTKQIVSKEN